MCDKRKQFESIYHKLSKMLPRLWSATDELDEADVVTTVRAINHLLRKAGLDLHDVVALLGERKDPVLEMFTRLLEKDPDALVRIGRQRLVPI